MLVNWIDIVDITDYAMLSLINIHITYMHVYGHNLIKHHSSDN